MHSDLVMLVDVLVSAEVLLEKKTGARKEMVNKQVMTNGKNFRFMIIFILV